MHDPDGEAVPAAELDALAGRLATLDHVLTVLPPRVSEDGATALVTVQYDVPVTHRDLYGVITPVEEAVAATEATGLQVELGGELPGTAVGEMKGTGELIGVVSALLILLLMFRSVVAAGLPVLVAVGGLAVGSGGIALLSAAMSVSPSAPMVATMVGLGVGIDYALLLLTRILEYRRAGHDVVESAARASVTAGRAVVLAGTTVLVSLLGPAALRPEDLLGLRLRHRDHRARRDADGAGAGARPQRADRPLAGAACRPARPQGQDRASGPSYPRRRGAGGALGPSRRGSPGAVADRCGHRHGAAGGPGASTCAPGRRAAGTR